MKRNLLKDQGKRLFCLTISPDRKVVSLFYLMRSGNHLPHNGTYSVKKKPWPFCDSKYNLIYTFFGTVFERNRVMLKFWKVAILVKYQLKSVVTVLGNNILLQCCMRYYANGYCHNFIYEPRWLHPWKQSCCMFKCCPMPLKVPSVPSIKNISTFLKLYHQITMKFPHTVVKTVIIHRT